MALGQGSRWEPVAHHRRHQDAWATGKMARWELLFQRVLAIIDPQVGLESYAGPGHWNDPDMLEVGNGGMTDDGISLAFQPVGDLGCAADCRKRLRNMRPEIHDILTNKEVIAVNQDALGREGERVAKNGDLEVWAKQLKDGSRAVILLNRGRLNSRLRRIGKTRVSEHDQRRGTRLWQHKELGKATGKFSASVAPHGVVMATVKP